MKPISKDELIITARVGLGVRNSSFVGNLGSGFGSNKEWNHNNSNITRLAYLWKYGGLYLDLDFLVLQPFEDREDNFVGAQHSSVSCEIFESIQSQRFESSITKS